MVRQAGGAAARLTAAAAGAVPVGDAVTTGPVMKELTPEQQRLRRPHLFWPNLLIKNFVLGVMICGWVDPVVIFMLGTAAALILNSRSPAEHRARIDAHAKAALLMVGILLAAEGARKDGRCCRACRGGTPDPRSVLVCCPCRSACCSTPTATISACSRSWAGGYHGLDGQPVEVAQASLLGQMTVGFPVSPLAPATFLIVGMAGIELRAHHLFSIRWLFGASVLTTAAVVALGILPI